jgi:PAS domain S-box-containing protein
MLEFFTKLLDAKDFHTPWQSGSWTAEHGWLHIATQLLLFAALTGLAGLVYYCGVRRRDLPYRRTFWLLGAFFLTCGLTHLGQALLFWIPVYRLVAVLQLLAAMAGIVAVVSLTAFVPRVLAWSSPQQLQEAFARRTRELHDSETRLRAIFESAEDGILTLDEEWTIQTANPVCERLFGVPVEQLLGQPFNNFISGPDSKSAVKKQVGTGEGKIFGGAGDFVGKRADGSTFQASLSLSKIRLDQGDIYNAIIHDVSAFKRTQEALRQSEARLRMMLAQVPAFLCTTDRKLRITLFASSAITGLSSTGFHISRFSGMSLPHAKDETLQALPVKAFRQALEGASVAVSTHWKDRVLQFHIQALRDTEGRIIGTIGIGLDVTEQKRTEAALRRSEVLIRAIVEAAGDAIITVREDGTIRLVNAAGERLFGYQASELIGQKVAVLMPSPYREQQEQFLQHYLATGEKKIIGQGREVSGQRKDGTTFPMHLSVSEVRLKKRRLFIGMIHDISEQKKTEQSLQFYAEQLQERNDQLLRSNQELDEFAYVASHDLKEPLRGIHHYCTFLIEDYTALLDADGRAKLERLQYLASHLSNLIDSLLQFSRVGRVDLAVQETDLNAVVEEVLDSLRISLQQQGVAVRIRGPLPTLRCDRVRIAEVFRNLITNAMKYNDKMEKWLEIGEADQEMVAGARHVGNGEANNPPSRVFYVRDNGIGIPEKHWEGIFRIFKRLHGRDKFGGGTGAGLTIVKKIIERHGGQILLQSTPGEGTTFFFTIPVDKPENGRSPGESESLNPQTAAHSL